jgi:hypothetical protein
MGWMIGAKVKECMELYFHSPNMPSWCGAHLKKNTGTTLPFTSYSSDILYLLDIGEKMGLQ